MAGKHLLKNITGASWSRSSIKLTKIYTERDFVALVFLASL
jgi:hypothetical protein